MQKKNRIEVTVGHDLPDWLAEEEVDSIQRTAYEEALRAVRAAVIGAVGDLAVSADLERQQ